MQWGNFANRVSDIMLKYIPPIAIIGAFSGLVYLAYPKSFNDRYPELVEYLVQDYKKLDSTINGQKALQQQIDNLTLVDSTNKELIVIYDDTTLVSLQQELKNIQQGIALVDERQTAIRQAISPTNPEEILTIARLTDAVNLLAERIDRQDEELERKQIEFRQSIIRELEKDDQISLLLISTIFLFLLNFLFQGWKDRKEKKAAAAPKPKPTTEA